MGFMGAGKSTVGPLLATSLGWGFIDLDQEIEKTEGRPIRSIFQDSGEPYFRRVERKSLEGLAKREDCVVALGGGAFVQENNRKLIRKLGYSVFLDCPLELALARCPPDGTRPLLQDREALLTLYQQRRPAYLSSDLHIEVEGRSPEEIRNLILQRIISR